MICRALALLVCATVACVPSSAYIRLKGANGTFLYRPDYAKLQVLLNSQAVPGLMNANGQTWITPDSDVAGALQGAIGAWNAVSGSAAQFLPAQTIDLTASSPGHDVIVFQDTPAVRSALGPSTLAFTVNTYNVGGPNDGAIASAYMYFNPVIPLSTTLAPKTYDLQSIFTHELGHVLGANHTGGIGAVMFQNINPNSTTWQNLSADDMAFVSNVYPATPAASAYGTIAGTLVSAGAALRNALVNAVDTQSGAVFSGLTSGSDGTYSIPAPPGTYFVFAEPITGNINYNFYLCEPPQAGCTADAIDSGFQPAFIGGTTPTPLAVSAGAVTNGDFSPPGGSPAVNLQYINTGAASGYGDQSSLLAVAQGLPVPSGGSADIIMVGPGIDTTLTDANVSLIGPISLQPGTVRGDMWLLSNGQRFIRMTVNVPVVSRPTSATLVLSKNGAVTIFPGGLILLPPPASP